MNQKPIYGPENPYPLSSMKTELVWEGKYDEYGNRRPVSLPTSPLPLQRIETIDEPHDREKALQPRLFDESAFHKRAHRDDFRNMLIWGDNKLAMASLLEQFRGKIDLIYIDPPFDVGADFTMQVQLGEEGDTLQKEQSIMEAVAYRDTWGKGTDSYLHMMYERLTLMRDLLSEKGTIYVHLGWQVSHGVRFVLEDVFDTLGFRNEISWQRGAGHADAKQFGRNHETILAYAKTAAPTFNPIAQEYDEERLGRAYPEVDKDGRRYCIDNLAAAGQGKPKRFGDREIAPPSGQHWRFSQSNIDQLMESGRIVFNSQGVPRVI